MTPVIRLVCAVALLSAYNHLLFRGSVVSGDDTPVAAALTDSSILRDIDASQVAYTSGRYADALEPTRRLTEKLPSQALYLDRLATIHRELGNRTDEARSLERVFAVSPTPFDACPMLGQAYEAVNDAARAVSAYERCVQADPENPDALLLLGRAYQAAGRGADARAVLEKAIALAPQYPDLYLLLGVRNYADGHITVAREQFERFLQLSPGRREEVAVWLERTKAVAR